ncbi:MAG: glycoside hydrolase family 13 protein [Opitutales bacterium]|nr:glycoside hydrolase family 13 protein [Opitutales bacterium]
MKILFRTLLLFISTSAFAAVDRVEPAFWWTQMHEPSLQLLLHGENIAATTPRLEYPGLTLEQTVRVENPNYLFLYLHMAPDTLPGSFNIELINHGTVSETIPYTLRERAAGSAQRAGFDNSDVIYLLMPDRFADGNTANNSVPGLLEQEVDRGNPYGRHGGDLKGITDHLDYLADMGFTALWLNPVLENNQPQHSYHGYAITDFYSVDPRYGTLQDYTELSRRASEKGIKLIMDMIFNHCGSEHWWIKDLPMQSWINYPQTRLHTNHRRSTNLDPHASKIDSERMTRGWFVDSMPDLNVDNPLLADYLIQNSIWWVEVANLGGIRIDTYPYPGKQFMARWCTRVLQEYPNLNLVGEEWTGNPVFVSYWQRGKANKDGYSGNLPSLFDFPNQILLASSFTDEETFSTGFIRLYEMLANDFLYADPDNLVVFLGNHDTPRFFTAISENIPMARNAMVWLATMRGIPQFYYGDEILMSQPEDLGDGYKRKDFPGGWAGDASNAFTGEHLTPAQFDFQQFVRKLFQWRKTAAAVQNGKLIHFAPEDGIYVYFRCSEAQTVMVVLNKQKQPYELSTERFSELLGSFTEARDILSQKDFSLDKPLLLEPETPLLLELR